MKKLVLYALAAIVLGAGVMLFPLWTFFTSYGEEGPIVVKDSTPYFKPMTASENWQEYTTQRDTPNLIDYTVQPQSADSSLQVLAIGFIAAMIAYVIVRRRVPRPTPYSFPPC